MSLLNIVLIMALILTSIMWFISHCAAKTLIYYLVIHHNEVVESEYFDELYKEVQKETLKEFFRMKE